MSGSNFTGVENALDIFDQNRLWYYIPHFNGYEVSNDGYVRSMKHYRRYPYGILIQPVKTGKYANSCDPLFEISDDDNQRQRIRLSQIMHLAATNQYAVYGYPRLTIITNSGSRNKYVRNKDGVYCKVYNGNHPGGGKNSYSIPPMDNTAHYPKFTIIQDGTERPKMEYTGSNVRVPIVPIKGDMFYGRTDCRCITNLQVDRPCENLIRGE